MTESALGSRWFRLNPLICHTWSMLWLIPSSPSTSLIHSPLNISISSFELWGSLCDVTIYPTSWDRGFHWPGWERFHPEWIAAVRGAGWWLVGMEEQTGQGAPSGRFRPRLEVFTVPRGPSRPQPNLAVPSLFGSTGRCAMFAME